MQYHFRPALPGEAVAILAFYRTLVGTPGCSWTMDYPSLEDVQGDLDAHSLYCMYGQEGALLGAAALCREEITAPVSWSRQGKDPCMLARIAIRPDLHGQGLGYALLQFMLEEAQRRGHDCIRLIVSQHNPSAQKLYQKADFSLCGEARVYDHDWFCYELLF